MPDPWEIRFDILRLADSTTTLNVYRARFDKGWARCDPWTDESHRHLTVEDAVECLSASVGGRLAATA